MGDDGPHRSLPDVACRPLHHSQPHRTDPRVERTSAERMHSTRCRTVDCVYRPVGLDLARRGARVVGAAGAACDRGPGPGPQGALLRPGLLPARGEQLWPRVWQMACRLEEIPEPGDFVEYEILDQSVIVLRGDDREVRAFHNVCRHRGVKLVAGSGDGDERVHLPVPRLVLRPRRREHPCPAATDVQRAQPATRRHRPDAGAVRGVGRLRVDQPRRRRAAAARPASSRPPRSSTSGRWSRCGRSGGTPAASP